MSGFIPRLKAAWHGPVNAHHRHIIQDISNGKLTRSEHVFTAMTRDETTRQWADYFFLQMRMNPALETNPRKMESLFRSLPYIPDATNYRKIVEMMKSLEKKTAA